MPLAHTEGSLTLSMTRGSTAAGDVKTYVLADRITRASCFVCADAAQASRSRAGSRPELPAMSAWLAPRRRPSLPPRPAPGDEDPRGRPDVSRALGVDDRRRGRPEHDDQERLRAEHGLRDAAGARSNR